VTVILIVVSSITRRRLRNQGYVKWDYDVKIQSVQPNVEPRVTLNGTMMLKDRVFSLVQTKGYVKWDCDVKIQGVQPNAEHRDTLSGTVMLKYRVFSLVQNRGVR
jgi:hypothetical protein